MIQTKLRVSAPDEKLRRAAQAVIPVNVPDLDEIRRFADELHVRNYVSLTWEHGREQEPHVLVGQEIVVI